MDALFATTQSTYALTFWALLLIITTLVVQSTIAAFVKAKQPGAIPGMEPELDQSNFVFRAYRTNINSLENFIPMFAATVLCIWLSANVIWTAIFVWLYAIARFMHMVLYYKISTNKNPSPRSHFFLLGYIATIGLVVLAALALLN